MTGASVKSLPNILDAIKRIDWSFDSPLGHSMANRDVFDARSHHWYPATFVPELPRAIIEITTTKGALVVDPFGGIGTTLFQALDVGRRARIKDLNQVAATFCRNMLRLIAHDGPIPALPSVGRPGARANNRLTDQPTRLDLEVLRPWFNPETFAELEFIKEKTQTERNPVVRASMEIALSASLMGLVGQEKGWGYIADNMLPKPEQVAEPRDAIARFSSQYARLARDVTSFRDSLSPESREFVKATPPDEIVELGDSRIGPDLPDKSADLLLTSPPYPSMADYATSQRLSYYLMGLAPDEDLRTEIGARRRRTRSQALPEYEESMDQVLQAWLPKVRPEGYACFVMPSYPDTDAKRRDSVTKVMERVKAYGFEPATEFDRTLPTRRRHHNEAWGRLSEERIYLFQRM